jgi:hypothetical protein
MLVVLALSFGSVIIGYIVQRLMDRLSGGPDLSDIAKWIKLVTLAVLLPWPILFTFWQIETVSSRYILVPILGLTSLFVGGLSALVYIRTTRMEPNKGRFPFCLRNDDQPGRRRRTGRDGLLRQRGIPYCPALHDV